MSIDNNIMSYDLRVSKIKGNKMLDENEFFRDLVALMENEQFKNFFKKHMFDWTSVKSTVIYMKLYNELKTKYKKVTNDELEQSIVVYLLTKIMRDKTLRPVSIKTIDKLYENGKGDFFNELENHINKKDNELLE